jgi:hypothetical protein
MAEKGNGCKSYPHPDIALAMAYVPFQEFGDVYNSEIGFDRGTIFEGLDKPFLGREGMLDD